MNELQIKYGPEYAKTKHPTKPHCHLRIFGFPCNQFGVQEPGQNSEILNGLKYVRPGNGFVPNFPLSKKLDVNGAKEHKLFTFLKSRCPAPDGLISMQKNGLWSPIRSNDVSWNFQKWLIGSDGQPYLRYSSDTEPTMIESDILQLIDKCVKGDGPAKWKFREDKFLNKQAS